MHLQIALLYLVLLITGVTVQLKLWKLEKFTAFSIFHAAFMVYYIFIPFVLEIAYSTFSVMPGKFTSVIYQASLNEKLYSYILVFIAYFAIIVSYVAYNKGILRNKNITEEDEPDRAIKKVYTFGVFFLIVGGGSILLFFMELGGFRTALRFAETLRYIGTDPSNYYGPLGAMFRMLSFLIMGASYCFKTYVDVTNNKKAKLYFYISFVLSIMYLLFNSGRATIIFFLIPFVLTPIIKKNKKVLSTLMLIFLGVIITAELFDIILYQITLGNFSSIQTESTLLTKLNSVLQDLTFPYANTINVKNMNEIYGYRFGQDYFIWLINILPSRIFTMIGITIPDFETINVNTTAFYFYQNPNLLGGIPTDLITLGVRQFNIPGLIINVMLFSTFALYFDKISRSIGKDYLLINIRIKLTFFTFIANNDLSAFVRGSLFILILIFMIRKIYKIRIYNKHKKEELVYENRLNRTRDSSSTY